MKHLKLLTAATAFSFILLTGCEKELDDAVNPALTNQEAQLARAKKDKLTLPDAFGKKVPAPNQALSGRADSEYRDAALKALNIEEDPTCDDNTAMNQWLDQQLADWNSDIITAVLGTDMLNLPTYDALVFENSSKNQYFGADGEYTHQVTKAFKDLQRFWDIQSDHIVLAAMHGNMLTDRDKIIRTYVAAYGLPLAYAEFYADSVISTINAFPQLENGEHPIFTFNAFALEGFDYPPYGFIPDKIIMGDGIMEAFTAIGYGDVAPQAILAHEFGHQIQFQLGLFGEEESPEATRRTELMADAYSAYYLSHARGATMQWKRVQQFLQVFFNIGDCSFDSDGHHGTPTQRMAAAEWGYNLADDAQKQGHILSAEEFARLFDEQLPLLIGATALNN